MFIVGGLNPITNVHPNNMESLFFIYEKILGGKVLFKIEREKKGYKKVG